MLGEHNTFFLHKVVKLGTSKITWLVHVAASFYQDLLGKKDSVSTGRSIYRLQSKCSFQLDEASCDHMVSPITRDERKTNLRGMNAERTLGVMDIQLNSLRWLGPLMVKILRMPSKISSGLANSLLLLILLSLLQSLRLLMLLN